MLFQNLPVMENLFTINCIEKIKIKKRQKMANLKSNNCTNPVQTQPTFPIS